MPQVYYEALDPGFALRSPCCAQSSGVAVRAHPARPSAPRAKSVVFARGALGGAKQWR
jgi:hypothetical protein